MLEILLILYIILLFIFPVLALAILLGTVTTWKAFLKYNLLKHQPAEGKKIILLNGLTFSANIFASFLVGLALALMVYFLIFENIYLFAFNFIFCTGISVRWFDYTHRVYRHFIQKLNSAVVPGQSIFAECLGLRETSGSGWGMIPVFADAGVLEVDDSKVVFHGVFLTLKLDPASIDRAEKKSFEKIKVFLPRPSQPGAANVLIIALKEQFYPFKSRETRDRIFLQLAGPRPTSALPMVDIG